MAEKKKSQEQEKKPPEEKVVKFEDLSTEEKERAKQAILQEMKDTNIIPSNPDSPHVKRILEDGGGVKEDENAYVETYWWVKFHQRSNPIDELRVKLTVNGDCLLIERGAKVPLPNRFLECADHTTHEEYSQEPGETRKVVSVVTTFPYERLGEATKEDYERFRKEGTQATKDQLVKDGTMSEREARNLN